MLGPISLYFNNNMNITKLKVKDRVVTLRMSERQLDLLKERAKKAGMSINAYSIRELCLIRR